MMHHVLSAALLVLSASQLAVALPPTTARRDATRNDGIHLAVGPNCGSKQGNATDINEGLRTLTTYETIVAFGDSYTTGGNADGGPLLPPVLTGTSPKAGGRTTNGAVWIEDVANDVNATFMDYAIGGAVTDVKLWPSKGNASDFVTQLNLFLSQNHTLDPKTTLYTVFFGINDYSAVKNDGDHLPQAAQVILDKIATLASPPTNAESFLVADAYGRGNSTPAGEAFKQSVFDGLAQLRKDHHSRFRYAYVDFKYIWNGVLGTSPGYQAFGYTSAGACTLNSSTVYGACSDPEHTFYWIPGHPSKETHRIMGDYTEEVLAKC